MLLFPEVYLVTVSIITCMPRRHHHKCFDVLHTWLAQSSSQNTCNAWWEAACESCGCGPNTKVATVDSKLFNMLMFLNTSNTDPVLARLHAFPVSLCKSFERKHLFWDISGSSSQWLTIHLLTMLSWLQDCQSSQLLQTCAVSCVLRHAKAKQEYVHAWHVSHAKNYQTWLQAPAPFGWFFHDCCVINPQFFWHDMLYSQSQI